MTIYKKEFADRMAENGRITKKAAYQAVELFIDTLMDYLGEEEKVMFTGFGKFEMKDVKQSKGRNPQNGEECIIPGHKRVKYTACRTLVEKIRERQEEST